MRLKSDSWIFTKPIAHRGLWNNEIVENSLSAYKNAVEKGYPIEIDLYSSTDGVLYSFHDNTLRRMTGAEGYIFNKSSEELSKLKLVGSDEGIPTFDQVLELVDGKVPLLIELKRQPDKTYINKVVDRLKSYKGEFAIQSFDPMYIYRVKRLAPKFIRGILGTKTYTRSMKWFRKKCTQDLILNWLIKPDFISYMFEDLPIKGNKTKKAPLIVWTITNQENADKAKLVAKNIIFEHFIPNEK